MATATVSEFYEFPPDPNSGLRCGYAVIDDDGDGLVTLTLQNSLSRGASLRGLFISIQAYRAGDIQDGISTIVAGNNQFTFGTAGGGYTLTSGDILKFLYFTTIPTGTGE